MMNKIKSNIYRLLPVVAVCLAAWSCSGEEGASMPQLPEVPEVPADPDALCTITPGAIEISYVDASDTPLTRSATGEPLQKVTQTENLGHNFSVEATLEAAPQEAQTRAVAMTTGAQYRIVVFNGSGAVEGNVVYKQGSTSVVSGKAINLKAGTYRLFCYSFNSTANIPAIGTNGDVTVKAGDDFMTYTVADFTVAPTDYANGKRIDISFIRQCTRLTIKVITNGNNDSNDNNGYTNNTITAASMKVHVQDCNNTTSLWNGLTKTDNKILNALNPSADLIRLSAPPGAEAFCGPTTSNKYLIMPSCLYEVILITNLKITIGNNALGTPSDFFRFTNVTLFKGYSYQLTLRASNYYMPTSGETVRIDGVEWATSNLIQKDPGNNSIVSFTGNPTHRGSHWNWGMRDATDSNGTGGLLLSWSTTTTNHANQDPCTAISSNSNTWRLPDDTEFDRLIAYKAPSGTKVKINDVLNTIGENGWAPDAKAFVAIRNGQVLVLYAAGTRVSSDSPMLYNGYYWSSESGNSTSGHNLTFGDAYGLKRTYSSRTSGYSVRCVKR